MFKRISEAYEVLSDGYSLEIMILTNSRNKYVAIAEDKRAVYDRHGEAGLKQGFSANDGGHGAGAYHFEFRSPFDVFHDFFATDPFKAFFNDHRPPFFAEPSFDDFFAKPRPRTLLEQSNQWFSSIKNMFISGKSGKSANPPNYEHSLGHFINQNLHHANPLINSFHNSFVQDLPVKFVSINNE